MPDEEDNSAAGGSTQIGRSTWYGLTGNLYLVFGSLVMAVLTILASWVAPRTDLTFRVARAWARGLLWASGVSIERDGPVSAGDGGSVVFMANHQSLYDIPAMLVTVPTRSCFLAKKSLFRIPVFGWSLAAAGFIPIDREDRSRAREAFELAMSTLGEGTSVIVFPEETRSLDGRIQPFQRGGFLMALKARAAIVPVGIQGTLTVRSRGSLRVNPGTVRVRFGEPVDIESFGLRRKKELVAAIEDRVSALAGAPRSATVS